MYYLFETENFLFRKKMPGEACRLPKRFPEDNTVYFTFTKGLLLKPGTPDVLMIEFRATGALAGMVFTTDPIHSLPRSEAACCLCKEFHKKRFKDEIINALSLPARETISAPPCIACHLTTINIIKTTAVP